MLTSFDPRLNAVVVGASGGIGAAVYRYLTEASSENRVLALSRSHAVARPGIASGHIDLEKPESIEAAARLARSTFDNVHLVFVATGILHDKNMQPEKTLRALDATSMMRAYAINAVGPALIAKHFLPLMPRQGKTVFAALSARVGSISDNHLGGWYAYRSSKSALNQFIRTAAIERARTHKEAVLLALHPGTTVTPLSKPFQGHVPKDKLFTPRFAAREILRVIDRAKPVDSGLLKAWHGRTLPY